MMTLSEFKQRYSYDADKDLLGEGGFSKVYKAYDTLMQRTVALKFYYGEFDTKYGVLAELKRVTAIKHNNLLRYYDAMLLSAPSVYGNKVQVGIMEYANAGDLNDFMKTFPSIESLEKVIKDILLGLEHLHKNEIVHRDIKPQNILMSRKSGHWTAKIADFGLSKKLNKNAVSSKLMGTMEYMAPEQFDTKRYGLNSKLGTNIDLWAFGVILYEMFTGDLPFGGRNDGTSHEQVMFNIMKKEISNELDDVMQPYQSIIKWCLVKHAAKRPHTARALLGVLDGKASVNSGNYKANRINDSSLPAVDELSKSAVRSIFAGNIIFTPLFGVLLYFYWKRHLPNKATQALNLAWWSLAAWLAVMLLIVIGMIILEI